MDKKQFDSFDDIFAKFEKSTEFQKADRQLKPFYDLIIEIINRRNDLGLTQKELAERAQTHQSRISKIESGEYNIRLSTLIKIAESLETEVSIKLIPLEYKVYNIPEKEAYVGLFQLVHEFQGVKEFAEEDIESNSAMSIMAYE